MSKQKVLYICHNHPSLFPGGAEAYALELYTAMRASGEFEPIFLARLGSSATITHRAHPGTPFSMVNGDAGQYFFFTETAHFDFFYMTSRNKDIYSVHFHEFLLAHQPDVVHFQHTLFLGYDLILQTRNTLPQAPIVYTLHEYLPICHRDGQMVRTGRHELCRESSPRRCHECFPAISPQMFFLRKRFIQSHFSLVDLFLAPSHFLLERYVDWGIPRERIRYEEYGRHAMSSLIDTEGERPRNRLGFFGQLNPFKGVDVLLKAMHILQQQDGALATSAPSGRVSPGEDVNGASRSGAGRARLWIHGANLELQSEAFQNSFNMLLEATKRNVTFVGRYEHTELSKLMANVDWVIVPSFWWENSPLVIQEAFLHGRPVICADIGGMAEKVTHGVNALHFRAGDPTSLAQTICQAVSSPGLWESLHKGIPQVYKIEEHVTTLAQLYHTLLDSKTLLR